MSEGIKLNTGRLTEDLKDGPDWFKLGIKLGITYSKLKEIERSHSGDVERCKIEMLEFWQQIDVKASLKKLTTALERLEWQTLAQKLRMKYNISPTSQPQADHNIGEKPSGFNEVDMEDFLNPSNEDLKEHVRMRCEIDQLDEDVCTEYGRFMLELQKLFVQQHVSENDLLYMYSCIKGESALTSDMQEASNVKSFMRALANTQSWYDFNTTASLAELLGEAEGERLVASYEAKLKVHFTQRIALKIPKKTKELVVKYNEERERFTKDSSIAFRNKVAKLLHIKPAELILKSVRKGCVEFTYVFPATLAPLVKNAIRKYCNDLEKHGVISMNIDGETVMPRAQHRRPSTGGEEVAPTPKRTKAFWDVFSTNSTLLAQDAPKTRWDRPNVPRSMVTRSVHQESPTQSTLSIQIIRKLVQLLARKHIIVALLYVLLLVIIAFVFKESIL